MYTRIGELFGHKMYLVRARTPFQTVVRVQPSGYQLFRFSYPWDWRDSGRVNFL